METTLDTKTAKNYTCAKREAALNDKMHRIQKKQEQRSKKEKDQNRKKNNQDAETEHLDRWQSMTNHRHTTRILHTAPDGGKDSKGSTQTYRIQFMGKTTSKRRVGRHAHTSLTSQTVMFTLLKCTGICDLQNKQLQFRGQFFPMQTIIAQIRTNTLSGRVPNHVTRIATAQSKCTHRTPLF